MVEKEKLVKNLYRFGFIGSLWVVLNATLASATVVAVDMDPLTPGVQSTLTVAPGAIFTVDVVVSDPVGIAFDTAILEVSFNDAGPVLGPGPTGILGGVLASNNLGITLDFFAGPAPSATGGTNGCWALRSSRRLWGRQWRSRAFRPLDISSYTCSSFPI